MTTVGRAPQALPPEPTIASLPTRASGPVEAAGGWSLAPYAMLRFNPVAGGPGGDAHLRSLDELAAIRLARRTLEPRVLDELYRLTPLAADTERRRVLLPVSRAVFNGKRPRVPAEDLAALAERCPVLGEWLDLVTAEGRTLAGLEPALDDALADDRRRLQRIVGSREFLLAAAISSPDLARGAERYAGTPLAQHNKRIRKAEPKLSRYAERAATKTSPFSYFTVAAAGQWASTGSEVSGELSTRDLRSRVEANLLLVLRLLDAALRDPELTAATPFRLRPELRRNDRGYEFEVMRDEPERSRIYQGRRSKIAIASSATTEALLAALDDAGGSATLGELTAALRERSANPPPEPAVRGYLDKLCQSGLLVPCLRVNQQADRPAAVLAAELDRLAVPPALVLAGQLRGLDRDTERIGGLTGTDRAEAVDRLRAAWEHAFGYWNAESTFDSPLYEDVALAEPVRLSTHRWDQVHTDLTELLAALEPLNMDHPGQVLMRLMMVDRYGTGGSCSYQDFVAMLPGVFTAERVSLAAILAEVNGRDPELARLLELRERYLAAISAAPDCREVCLEPGLLRQLAEQTPAKFRRGHASVSAFLQPVSERDGRLDTVVLNAVLDGDGQFLSRFLRLWGDERTEQVRRHLRATMPSGATELRPVQGFNANVHPPMLAAQFALAEQGEQTEPAATQVAAGAAVPVEVRELTVRHDPLCDRLVLHDQRGQAVHPRYLGFLVPYLLPWELTGLYLLSEPSQLRVDGANELERRVPAGQAAGIRHYPRVRYRSVVLNRARWYVPRELFPFQDKAESLTDYLVRLDDWRIEHAIAQRVFLVRLDGDTGENRDALGRPKPMYADLRSPLHVRSLASWLGEAAVIRLDEALPDPAAPQLADPHFPGLTTEYLIECYQNGVRS